jgi:hypothetical protein
MINPPAHPRRSSRAKCEACPRLMLGGFTSSCFLFGHDVTNGSIWSHIDAWASLWRTENVEYLTHVGVPRKPRMGTKAEGILCTVYCKTEGASSEVLQVHTVHNICPRPRFPCPQVSGMIVNDRFSPGSYSILYIICPRPWLPSSVSLAMN